MLKSQKPESEAPVKYYALIDTNGLVSAALKWESVPGSIIDLAFNKVIVPLVNKEILEEYRSILLRPKFHLTEEIVQDIIDEFVSHALDISEEHLEKPVYADSFSDTSIHRFFYFLSMHTRYSLVPSSYFLIPDSMKPWA